MARRGLLAASTIFLLAGVVTAQSTLSPFREGTVRRKYTSTSGLTTYTATSILSSSSTMVSVGYFSGYTSSSTNVFVLKFDITGLALVLDARLVVYASGYSWAYMAGGPNESSTLISTADFMNSGTYANSMASTTGEGVKLTWDITSELNTDISSLQTHSDYVVWDSGSSYDYYTTHSTLKPYILYTAIPEPGTLALFGAGLATFAAGYFRRRKKRV